MFSKELKEYTADAHMSVERKMIPHLKTITSVFEYVKFLDYLLGYYSPLEKLVNEYLPGSLHHSPAANIQHDVKSLDPNYQLSVNPAPKMPGIHSKNGALGVLYVIEGSTLGGQVITRMISKQIQSDADTGFSFYNPYGDNTAYNWNNFKKSLDQPFTEPEKAEIMDGANQTFQTLNNWISNYGGN